jgi:hypothetical protein
VGACSETVGVCVGGCAAHGACRETVGVCASTLAGFASGGPGGMPGAGGPTVEEVD